MFLFYALLSQPQAIAKTHMTTAIIIDSLLVAMLIVLIVVKTLHFNKYLSSKRKNFINWIYFGHQTVIASRSSKSIAIKRKQNTYSVSIGVVLLMISFAIALEVIILGQPLPNSAHPSERPTAPTIKR